MLRWIINLVGSLGYLGVGVLMAVENVVLPLPSELIMPLAGFLAARGRMTLWGAILAGTIGSVVGAFPLYALARAVGERRLAKWVDAYGKWLLVRGKDLKKANARFEERGGMAVFLSQLLPGLRGLISLPAGFAGMNVALFALANFLGTIIWCAALACAGYLLGAHYDRVHRYLGPVTWAVLAGLLVGGVVWAVRRRKKRKR